MKNFKGLLKTEFERIFANKVLLAIFIGAPILYGFLFGYVYKQAKVVDLPVLIVDQDHSPSSDKLIDAFGDNEGLMVSEVRYTPGDIKSEMPFREYASVITIPQDFEADLLQKRHPEIRVDLNMTNILNANIASKNIQAVLMTINAGIEIEGLKKQGLSPTQAKNSYESFKINFNKLYNSTGNYSNFMLPGLLAAIMQQVIFLALALVFARDFEDGYFRVLAKIKKWSVSHIWLKAVPFLIMIPVMWAVIAGFFEFFRVEADIYNLPMLLLTILLSVASMGIGMLFSIVIPSQLKATELLMVISTPAFVLSGFTWPSMAIPGFIQGFAEIIPLTHFLNGYRKVAIYGGGFSSIAHEIGLLSIITVVSFLTMAVLLQAKIKRSRRNAQEEVA